MESEALPQPQPPAADESAPQPENAEKRDYVLPVASLLLGLIGLCAWLLPFWGLPLAVAGLILGVLGRRSSYPNIATAAVVLCGLGIIASIANLALGADLGITGWLSFLR
jgi:hypothetical protein